MIEGKENVLSRVWNLLTPDRVEIRNVYIFAIFSGILSLGLPLGIQMIINFIQLGQLTASWFLLIGLVVVAIGFSGLLNILQLRITENLQQRIFSRASFEFAYRIPKLKLEALRNVYYPEINTRFFDTLTIQKAISKLLIDFTAASLQILLCLTLLAFYHGIFIFFGLILLTLIFVIIRVTSKKGYATSLNESSNKYIITNWLNEINAARFSYRNTGSNYHLDVTDTKLKGYLNARKSHFKILVQQYSYLILFKILITLCLLIVGGLLVVNQEMNIGQFVAAEIIIVLVLSSVEKIILNLELVYDVLTATEKIGQVTDLPLETDEGAEILPFHDRGFKVDIRSVSYNFEETNTEILNELSLEVESGKIVSIISDSSLSTKTLFLILLDELQNYSGSVYFDNLPANNLNRNELLKVISSVLNEDRLIFASVWDNIIFGRNNFDLNVVVDICNHLQIDSCIDQLKDKYQTILNPDDLIIPKHVEKKLLLARALIGNPRMVLIDEPTANMNFSQASNLVEVLHTFKNPTIIVSSHDKRVHEICDQIIEINNGRVTFNGNYESYYKSRNLC